MINEIMAYIAKQPDPIVTAQVAEHFRISTKAAGKKLRLLLESGQIRNLGTISYPHYVSASWRADKKVVPRAAVPFRPLKSIPSALGTREGSNDHLQHKSKHIPG